MVSGHEPIATITYRGWWRTHHVVPGFAHREQRVAHYSPGRLTAYTYRLRARKLSGQMVPMARPRGAC